MNKIIYSLLIWVFIMGRTVHGKSRIYQKLRKNDLINQILKNEYKTISKRNAPPLRYINVYRQCDCGIQNYTGRNSNLLHKYPWTVYIIFTKHGKTEICSGSIINEFFILTAAHCFMEGNTLAQKLIDLASIKVHAGDLSLSTSDDFLGIKKIIAVQNVIIHEKVQLKMAENDIALLRLSTPLDLKSQKEIKSICLPYQFYNNLYGEMIAAGWGKTQYNGKGTRILQETVVYIDKICLNPTYRYQTDPRLLCISAFTRNSFMCEGDSGGPIMRVNNGRYEVVGIVSATFGNDGKCSQGLSVAVNVAYYYNWIWTHVQQNCA
ncbi:UNVERIFIED_CONTAM: hypothetical protein RMT77_018756 [Armadillidium vulgare]